MLFILTYILLFLFLCLTYRLNRDIFSPAVFTSAIWFICFTFFFIIPNNLVQLSYQFLFGIVLWVVGFSVCSLLFDRIKIPINRQNKEASKLIRDIYLLLSILSVPILFIFLKDVLTYGTTDNIFYNLRYAATGHLPPHFTAPFGASYGGVFSLIWSVCFILEMAYINKKNKYRFLIILIINLLYGILTMSKTVFVNMFIMSLVLLYISKKVKLKQLIIIGSCIIFLFFVLQSVRNGVDFSNVSNRFEFITLYLCSSMSAFGTIEPYESVHFGENVFRFFYHIMYALGLSNIEPIDPLLPFVRVPISTNTYTIMYPFYKDFGILAVFVFACLYGLLYGYLYKKMRVNSNNRWYLILYAFMFRYLFYQYASESILTNLYPIFISLILLYIPFGVNGKLSLKNIKNNDVCNNRLI